MMTVRRTAVDRSLVVHHHVIMIYITHHCLVVRGACAVYLSVSCLYLQTTWYSVQLPDLRTNMS